MTLAALIVVLAIAGTIGMNTRREWLATIMLAVAAASVSLIIDSILRG